jgi:uncharacterized protein (UPF0276 family)
VTDPSSAISAPALLPAPARVSAGVPAIGVNVASAPSFAAASAFARDGLVEMVELVVDNFLHLDPEPVARQLDGLPVALHVMASGFLDHPESELRALAARLRTWVAVLRPLYVSDHLARHVLRGRHLPDPVEAGYDDDSEGAGLVAGVARWQEMLGQPLLLENYPSSGAAGRGQVAFFGTLERRCGVRPLFDVSNAVVAEANGGDAARLWLTAGLRLDRCHVSGYSRHDLGRTVLVDSHDQAVSPVSWALLDDLWAAGHRPASLVVERDDNLDDPRWADDLARARAALLRDAAGPTPAPAPAPAGR